MPHYAILVYERERSGGTADLPPEVLEAHARVESRIVESGGTLIAGYATEPPEQTRSLRGPAVTEGPFAVSPEAMAGLLIVEARDLDHAVRIGSFVPVLDGGIEVRPLLG
ncbi:MAG TPA: YciI family protein [Amycolatopsis sp.]|nr:YciI family protein [Amycolatopsis sp.]